MYMWPFNLSVTYTQRVLHGQKARAPNNIFIFLPLERRKSILRLKKRQEATADVAQGMQIKQE